MRGVKAVQYCNTVKVEIRRTVLQLAAKDGSKTSDHTGSLQEICSTLTPSSLGVTWTSRGRPGPGRTPVIIVRWCRENTHQLCPDEKVQLNLQTFGSSSPLIPISRVPLHPPLQSNHTNSSESEVIQRWNNLLQHWLNYLCAAGSESLSTSPCQSLQSEADQRSSWLQLLEVLEN